MSQTEELFWTVVQVTIWTMIAIGAVIFWHRTDYYDFLIGVLFTPMMRLIRENWRIWRGCV